MTWDDVVTLITGAGTARLATASPDGAPHVSVVAPAPEGDGLWMATTRTSGKAANLLANPRLALMWQGNDAETYLWGRAEVVEDPATIERVWHAGIFPFDPASFWGAPDNPDLLVLRVHPERVTAMVAGPAGLERRRWSVD